MLIHLSDVLVTDGKKCSYTVPVELSTVHYHGNECPVLDSTDMVLTLENKGDQKIEFQLNAKLKLALPCDRCLEDTAVDVEVDVLSDIDMKESATPEDEMTDEELDAEKDRLANQTFIEGRQLDTVKLLEQELMLRIPEKVLCKEDCKGICYQCGKNLNYGDCDCVEEPKDPRMAAILDLFNASVEK